MRAFQQNVGSLAYVTSFFYLSDNSKTTMLIIRLYISALTVLFLGLVIATRGLGILEAIVVTCAVVYLIIDSRIDLQALKGELRRWQELEERVTTLLRYP